jgi:tetratricopeptide (TPR) repeat protein
MAELMRRLAELRSEFVPAWSEARCRQLLSGICRLRRRRRLLGALGACAVGLVAATLLWGRKPPAVQLMAALPADMARTATAAGDDWLTATQRGDHHHAYELLAEGAPVADDANTLLRAADAARLSGHPEASVGYFRALLRDHRQHPAAPTAAFTLGRVLLEHLGRPVEAAEAFATANELARDSELAQNALAHEVECWSKAGRSEQAYRRALLFSQRYPQSRRQRMVQLYGGLASQ